jgi:hypothetical protein
MMCPLTASIVPKPAMVVNSGDEELDKENKRALRLVWKVEGGFFM